MAAPGMTSQSRHTAAIKSMIYQATLVPAGMDDEASATPFVRPAP
jgi:hypothetical protein